MAPHHPVQAGHVFRIDICVQAQPAQPQTPQAPPSAVEIPLTFHDAQGALVDPRLATAHPPLEGLDPVRLAPLPADTRRYASVRDMADVLVCMPPPDAVEMRLGPLPEGITLAHLTLTPLALNWADGDARRRLRAALVAQAQQGPDAPARDGDPPLCVRQFDTLCAAFAPGGDWAAALSPADVQQATDDYRHRMGRLRALAGTVPNVGYIGSDRGYEQLDGMACLFRLRRDSLDQQLAFLDLDLILVESGLPCVAQTPEQDWSLAFSSLDGALPDAGHALLQSADARAVPVHLWFTDRPENFALWQAFAHRASQVTVKGTAQDWAAQAALLPKTVQYLPAATCPTACSFASTGPRRPDLIVMPAASDVFHNTALAQLIAAPGCYDMMLTDFRYRVSNAALSLQLGHVHRITTRDHTRAEQRLMLQSARLVLLPADSLLTDACLLDIALDAIVSGAIPVMFGTPRGAHSLLHALDRVHSAADLVALQARYRTAWLAERRSRRLMCDVMRDHILTAAHRTALLGMDPFEAAFDTPPISTVLISKRPHLLAQCLAAFRRQSWANKELVLILNTGALPGDMPDLAPNEHVMSLPVTANIGECLNRAIAFSTGRYWAKMDDDDTYADTYLEETVHAYRASQADVVGRASVLFYFQRHDETHSRFSPAPPTRELLTSRYVSGATLSGDTRWLDLPFSPRDRNSMDTHWLHAVMSGGHRVLCADMTSLIVFRSSKDSDHTWQLTRSAATMRNFTCLAHGDVKDRMALYR